MTEKELLRILQKYGFHSAKNAPFLYVENDTCGIFYVIKHPFYGLLKRVFLPKTSVEAELFIAKFYWYKKQEKKINVELSDYKIKNPDLKYFYNEQELSLKDMENLYKNIQPEKKNNDKYLAKLKRTIHLLIGIIEAKIKNQQITYQNLIRLSNEQIKKENEFQQLYSQRTHIPARTLSYNQEATMSSLDYLDKWKEEVLKSSENLEEIIHTLTNFIYKLEIDEGYLKNKYELIKIPLNIDVLKTKIGFLQNPDSKKVDLERALSTIEEKSTLKKIVSYAQYKENEEKRMAEKYSMIPDIDIRTLGDFFMEFDNIKLPEPNIIENIPQEAISFEKVMATLENSFDNFSKEQQDYFMFYEFVMRNIIRENDNETEDNIKELINCLNNPSNIMIRIKFFKNIKTTSIEDCYKSIKAQLNNMEIFYNRLLGDINVFWKDKKIITSNLIKASSKRLYAPVQNSGENDVNYLGTLKAGTSILFIPKTICYDMNNDDILIVQEKPIFIIDTKHNSVIQEEKSLLKVVDYQEEKNNISQLTIVTNLISKKINLYKTVIIERNPS